ncbi:MAG: hypothetical protein M0Z60_08455 [Nitrospiraceae bacterium]|nr:hypothetical protein [Nitrospiraceae bacterium]
MKKPAEGGQELLRCAVCDIYIRKEEGFTCPRCRRGPLCRGHRVPKRRECASCVFDMRNKELIGLREQEQSLKSFLRLLQFLFIVFAIFFVVVRVGAVEMLDFLQDSFIADGAGYLGALSVVGYAVFYFLMIGQRQKIREMEEELNKAEFRRMVK